MDEFVSASSRHSDDRGLGILEEVGFRSGRHDLPEPSQVRHSVHAIPAVCQCRSKTAHCFLGLASCSFGHGNLERDREIIRAPDIHHRFDGCASSKLRLRKGWICRSSHSCGMAALHGRLRSLRHLGCQGLGNRALVKRQTYAESACWYSLQVAKLTVPLSYNFITMLPLACTKRCHSTSSSAS